ncbi:hypothetical protein MAA_01404 [Metarhizium robertsii ARSEF 23]|uniref:2EXR domain-containing protein n=1 Tax=Metarhizium robertsii (strain ARSEF 23 / ATCC MYA-3075) TaxID=655844 RepID=E9EKD2_METRA|nr:uncharacterized protein MAA_01404 [Metarhizium robertsii ARSEF 23]EFZ04330.1 hypothetical protein MAA_01404 [Metarhizium robertsii ARSEF 23]
MPPRSFPKFPRLPTEIRCYIWRVALRQPRVHRLRTANVALEQPHSLLRTETLPRSTITTRDILATCRESRNEALHALPNLLPLSDCMIHFNGREDVICLVKVNLDVLDALSEAVLRYRAPGPGGKNGGVIAKMPDALDWVDKVTKLALEARNSDFHDDFGFSSTEGIDQNHLLRFMSMFPKLEWLFLIVLPSPDDMETVIIDEADDDVDDEEHEGEGDKDATTGDEDTTASFRNGGSNTGSIGGYWIRGENGISDWYRWVPRSTTWDYSTEKVQTHFSDMAIWKDSLQATLRHHGDESRVLRSVQVEVMLHFREGAEPPSDL